MNWKWSCLYFTTLNVQTLFLKDQCWAWYQKENYILKHTCSSVMCAGGQTGACCCVTVWWDIIWGLRALMWSVDSGSVHRRSIKQDTTLKDIKKRHISTFLFSSFLSHLFSRRRKCGKKWHIYRDNDEEKN